jgi:hypothetical protein
MRIYLNEDIFPTFDDENLVFWERGIELGDYQESRKTSVDVPISKVCRYSIHLLPSRKFKIMERYSHISSFRKAVQLQIPLTQHSILNCPTIQSKVLLLVCNLIAVLSRYMPKKKEVHLKKLIKSGDEDEKETEVQVHLNCTVLISGIQKKTYCLSLAFQFDHWYYIR